MLDNNEFSRKIKARIASIVGKTLILSVKCPMCRIPVLTSKFKEHLNSLRSFREDFIFSETTVMQKLVIDEENVKEGVKEKIETMITKLKRTNLEIDPRQFEKHPCSICQVN